MPELHEVKAGDQPSASQWNELIRRLRKAGIVGPGVSNLTGTTSIVPDAKPTTARFAFVVGIDRESKRVHTRDATWVAEGADSQWVIAQGAESVMARPPGPGLSVEDFEPFIVPGPLPPRLTDPVVQIIDDAVWPDQGSPATQGVWHGKIIEVNLHAQIAFVAPIKEPEGTDNPDGPNIPPRAMDPTNVTEWGDPEKWDLSMGRCVWIGGYTGYLINQPVWVADVKNSTLPWSLNSVNLTGEHFQAFCTPDGPFAPQRELGCDPPDDPPLCDTGACCLPQDCFSTTEQACEGLNGTFYPGQSCTELAKSGECRPEFPCCLPEGLCRLLSESACNVAAGMFFPDEVACGSFECPQEVSCCFPDGTCGLLLEPVCAAANGTPVADCGACESTVGCCIEYNEDFTTRQCIDNTSHDECHRRAWCIEFPHLACGWFADACAVSGDCV